MCTLKMHPWMFVTVIFLHCQSYKLFKVILILLHKVFMSLHSLLEGGKELFDDCSRGSREEEKQALHQPQCTCWLIPSNLLVNKHRGTRRHTSERCIDALSITRMDFGPEKGLHSGRTWFCMKELNKAPVIEPCLTVHAMYPLTVYAGSTLHRSLRFNGVDVEALIPWWAQSNFRSLFRSFAADSSMKTSWSAVQLASCTSHSARSSSSCWAAFHCSY